MIGAKIPEFELVRERLCTLHFKSMKQNVSPSKHQDCFDYVKRYLPPLKCSKRYTPTKKSNRFYKKKA